MNVRPNHWSPVILWTVLIYATVPIGRPICDFLIKKIPFSALMTSVVLIVLAGVCVYFIKKVRIRKPSSYFLLGLTCVLYLIGLKTYPIPAEKIHFLEYGFLFFLIFRAVNDQWPGAQSYGIALALTALIGWSDEGLQSLTPGRYYQLADVGLNVISGALGLLLTYIANREGNRYC